MTQALITLVAAFGGILLGAWLARRNETRAAGARLLVDSLNDLFGAIADVANNVPAAQARYASAASRVAVHGSAEMVAALRAFQGEATTATNEGRQRLVAVAQCAREELARTGVT